MKSPTEQRSLVQAPAEAHFENKLSVEQWAAVQRLKAQLKTAGTDISVMKKQRKGAKDGHVPGLTDVRWDCRARHIAYSLARGRTRGEIEQKTNDSKMEAEALNERVDFYTRAIMGDSKLCVVVNGALHMTPSQMAVQAGHAVAEFCQKYPNSLWSNGILIYLEDKNGASLRQDLWFASLHDEVATFYEPDLGGAPTARAIHAYNFGTTHQKQFSVLKLPSQLVAAQAQEAPVAAAV